MNPLSDISRRILHARLSRLHDGHLVVRDGAAVARFGDPAAPSVTVIVHDARFYTAIVFGGSISAGESYGDGWWTSDDLTGVVRLMLRNRDVLEGLETGFARLAVPARRLYHALNRNTRARSRRNIAAHYDLSNEFFASFLDESLTYSCALFEKPGATLLAASEAKYARIAALLDLQPTDRVMEIGTGWGGFAIHAASRYGCHVTTTTISDAQHAFASQRVAAAGLEDRVTLLTQDYRELEGTFDKVVSIEMIEAVGHEHYDEFFARCAALLTPEGRAVIQAITIRDDRYEDAKREVDFIKRHIFPGSCIPSREVLGVAAAGAGLRAVHTDEIGLHYAETLRRWRDNMRVNRHFIGALGFDARFQRLWEFYFCYCEGGFLERAIGTAQIVFAPAAAAPFRVPAAGVPASPCEGVAA